MQLEIIAPDGERLAADAVDEVVVRRREPRFELGSEIAIFPGHAPMLIQLPDAPVRYRSRGQTFHVIAAGGFVEVKRDRVLIVTPRLAQRMQTPR